MPLTRTSAGVEGRCPIPVGPAQHSWCGPDVRGFLWGLHSTAVAALACGGSCGGCTAQLVRLTACGGCCGACTAQLVRPCRAGVPVGAAQHSWCGPGVRRFPWGLHSTAGAALTCGGSCGACTAQLVRPWRAVRFPWGRHSTAGAAPVLGGTKREAWAPAQGSEVPSQGLVVLPERLL